MRPVSFLLLLPCLLAGYRGASPPTPVFERDICLYGGPCGILVDDADAAHVEITAYWLRIPAEGTHDGYGPTVLSDDGVGADGVVRFKPAVTKAGLYDVYLYWPRLREEARPLATNTPVTVHHAGGSASFSVNMRAQAQTWYRLDAFRFEPGQEASVEIRNDEANGLVLADAVLFRPVR